MVLFMPDLLENRLIVLADKLVPDRGPAETFEGELVRAINRILYRFYNDGDYWYSGYGAEVAGPCVTFLKEQPHLDLSEEIKSSEFTGSPAYETALFAIAEKIVDYVESKNGAYMQNQYDMLDFEPEYNYDDEDDYYDDDDE